MPSRTAGRPVDATPASAPVIGLVVLLALLAAVYFLWPVWRAQWLLQIDQNEAWNAHWAAIAHAGGPLYPGIESLIANNYPPLSYVFLGWLSGFGLDPVLAGRTLSLVATLVAAAGVGTCVVLLDGGRIAGLVAALWFVATLARFYSDYVGMDDPHLVALAGMIWALAWLLAARRRGWRVEPAFILMAVAGFYKHTLLATPATAFLWLLLVDWRAALRGAVAGGLVAAAGLGFSIARYGHGFVEQLTAPRVMTVGRTLGSLGRLQWIAPGLIIAGLAAWLDRRSIAARLVLIYLLIAFLGNLLQQTGQGIANNAQFELVTATAIGIGLAFDRLARHLPTGWSTPAARILILLVLVARLVISFRAEPYLLLASEPFRQLVRDTDDLAASEAGRVSALSGTIVCTIPLVCYRAGKPYVYDLFSMSQQVLTGQTPAGEMERRVSAADITMVAIDKRASMEPIRKAASLEHMLPWSRD